MAEVWETYETSAEPVRVLVRIDPPPMLEPCQYETIEDQCRRLDRYRRLSAWEARVG
jgi:hypothetical protein